MKKYIGWILIISSFIPFGIAIFKHGWEQWEQSIGLIVLSYIMFYLGVFLIGKQVYEKYRNLLFKHKTSPKE